MQSDSLTVYEGWFFTPELVANANERTISITPRSATWSSSDPAIADVDASGCISGVSAGTTVITATLQGLHANLLVTVQAPVLPPEKGPIDPFLVAAPAANSLHEVPVVIIRYLPTTDGVNLDVSFDPDFWTLNPISLTDLKRRIDVFDKRVKFMLEEGSRFRGYKDPTANASIGYKVVDYITVYEPTPPGKPLFTDRGFPIYSVDVHQIFQRFNGENYVNNLGVKEFWIWTGGFGPGFPSYNPSIHKPENFRAIPESNMSSPTTGDISNSFRDNTDLPIYNRTYVVYGQNFRRTQAEAVHNHGHQLEAMLSHVNYLQDGTTALFWKKFVGQDESNRFITGRCGWTHMPPNTTQDYDYQNMIVVESDIEDWTPEGIGQRKQVNALTWGNIPYSWPDGTGQEQKTESHWYIYWMQSMPGRANQIPYGQNRMTNWWQFTADWDASIRAGLGLYEPLGCGYSLSETSHSFEVEGGTGTVSVSAGSACRWIATSNAPWINITSGSAAAGARTVTYTVADNANGSPRQGTLIIAGQTLLITQAGFNPLPTLSSLTPSVANAGQATFTLTVNGADFVPGAVVRWNGSERTTTYVNTTTLQASIPPADLASPGSVEVTVFNPAPGGGLSNALPFTIAGPDFTLGFDSPTVNADRGTKVRVTVNINRTGGFSGNVTVTPPEPSMAVKVKPPGPVSTTEAKVSFKLKIKATALTGAQQLMFTGRDEAGRTRNAVLTLVIR